MSTGCSQWSTFNSTDAKFFADDISFFSVVNNASVSVFSLNNDFVKIRNWAFNWKMLFSPNPNKQAKEIVFSKKLIPCNHPSLFFNNSVIEHTTTQKHLGLPLDQKLTFQNHVSKKFLKN